MNTPAPLAEFTIVPKGTLINDPKAALTIQQAFEPYVAQFRELSVMASEIKEPKEAKVMRLKLRKVRTDTDKKHQEMKADSLAYGRALDTAKNLINEQIQPIEQQLEEIEKAEERRLAQILKDRREQHLSQLRPFLDPLLPEPFVDGMTDAEFAQMLDNAKLLHQAKIDRREREEKERIERERQEREEKERQQAELDRLREESLQQQERLREERERAEQAQRDQEEKHRKEMAAAAEKQRKEKAAIDLALKKQKDAADAKLKKEREAAQAKLDEERRQREAAEEQARLQREELERQQRERDEADRLKREDEERRQQAAADAAERAAQAPDKVKLAMYVTSLMETEIPMAKTAKGRAAREQLFGLRQDFAGRAAEIIAKL